MADAVFQVGKRFIELPVWDGRLGKAVAIHSCHILWNGDAPQVVALVGHGHDITLGGGITPENKFYNRILRERIVEVKRALGYVESLSCNNTECYE